MNISFSRVVMVKFIWLSVLLLLLQGCEGKIDSKNSDDNAPSAVKNDSSTPSQPVDNKPLIINGHTLPPEPDPNINSATLLGVDVNHNDVRDDVERWIYMTYKDKHPIHIDIAMQAARGCKLILEEPEHAREIHDEVDKSTYCQLYYKLYAKYFNEPILLQEFVDTDEFRQNVYFNTLKRQNAYLKYDGLLSGGAYPLLEMHECKKACEFNTSQYK